MSDDLVFGDVQMAEPEKGLRPDRNRHYAVVEIGNPKGNELPIYIDLDVMRDIEAHAASDTSVELGGVLLGGQHHDDDGKPFVVITDSLRAQHYESTKGSFKFTHETWSAITKERDEFPPECQMVGWYHTHPDWGVFLSGMDLFICNNFFNKPLDVAYVVDPCRLDRGMFQWTEGSQPVTRRTGGFYLMASRFRQDELEDYVAVLKGELPMPGPNERGATVVNLHGQQPNWMGPAVLGMLSLQFCLLALIAWKMLDGQQVAGKGELAQLLEQRALEERSKTQTDLMDRVLRELKGTPKGYVGSLQEELEAKQALQRQLDETREISALRQDRRDEIMSELAALQKDAAATKASLEKKLATADASRLKLQEQLAALQDKGGDGKDNVAVQESSRTRWIVVGGGLAVLVIACVGALAMKWQTGDPPEGREGGDAGNRKEDANSARTRMSAGTNPTATDAVVRSLTDEPRGDQATFTDRSP